jgi:glyoxylase-like metal-dependent hydrolase (beta-lactamase superfamily II)
LARSNGGFVDLGGVTVVIDTHMTPLVSREVKAAAEAVTVRPVDYVFYTHWHRDHVFGGQAYGAETRFISTADSRRLMIERIEATYASSRAGMQQQIAALQETVEGQSDPNQRHVHQRELESVRELFESLADFQPRFPDITFTEHIELHGSQRSAALLSYGGGHSPNDAMLYLPDDGILFSGDLLVSSRHPFMGGGGDPHEWIRILLRIESDLAPATVVPGHGPLGALDDLVLERQYLSEMERLVRQSVSGGMSLAECQAMELPEEYAAWPASPMLGRNVEFLYNRITG